MQNSSLLLTGVATSPVKTFCAFKILLHAENNSIEERHPMILQCIITFEFDRSLVSYETHKYHPVICFAYPFPSKFIGGNVFVSLPKLKYIFCDFFFKSHYHFCNLPRT